MKICADGDERFASLAAKMAGIVLVPHVRARTVGGVSLANTHPFHQGRWVLAHNGTIEDLAYIREQTSPERALQREGETDSEWLFAFLLTRLDARGLTDSSPAEAADEVIAVAIDELTSRRVGSLNFVLSNGAVRASLGSIALHPRTRSRSETACVVPRGFRAHHARAMGFARRRNAPPV